jgi:arylsulfatase A-like enzyme
MKLLPCSLLVLSLAAAASVAAAATRPNILFIAADDLRPQLGCYGEAWMQTPHLDRLAQSAVRFDRHYVQIAVCIPSRVAMLTSLRSERTQQVFGPMRWQRVSGAAALGNTFRGHGYAAVSLGKIWHAEGEAHGDAFDREWAPAPQVYASRASQSLMEHMQAARKGKRASKKSAPAEKSTTPLPPITESADVGDEAYADGRSAREAVAELRRLAGGEKPFLLAVGFLKPHIPFAAPKKYWDLYRESGIPLAAARDFPRDMPAVAFSHHPNFYNYDYGARPPLPKGTGRMPDDTARHLIHAYAAATSYMDAQVGKVLAELERLRLTENTVVVFWGDHGFHLGDAGHWGKQTNFERATRSPLMIRAPGVTRAGVCSALVETVDLFPTLLDLAGLPALAVSDGTSLRPWLRDPAAPSRPAVYHVFNRTASPGTTEPRIGFAVRTADSRYLEWHRGWTLDGPLVAREYYRYSAAHPDEEANLADDPARAGEVAVLAKLLRASPGWVKR